MDMEFVAKGRVAILRDNEEVRERVDGVLKVQNGLIEKIAQILDHKFPPEEFGPASGIGNESPGEVVRQFIVKLDEPEPIPGFVGMLASGEGALSERAKDIIRGRRGETS